jgi:hypothetical protein
MQTRSGRESAIDVAASLQNAIAQKDAHAEKLSGSQRVAEKSPHARAFKVCNEFFFLKIEICVIYFYFCKFFNYRLKCIYTCI